MGLGTLKEAVVGTVIAEACRKDDSFVGDSIVVEETAWTKA